MKKLNYLTERAKLPPGAPYSQDRCIFIAKKFVTMNPDLPEVQAVSVCNGYIESVGTLQDIEHDLKSVNKPYTVDTTFQNDVIFPGFIDAHTHALMDGIQFQLPYVGYADRHRFDGSKIVTIKGSHTIQDCIQNLKKEFAKFTPAPGKWFNAWGFDNALLENEEMLTKQHLDQVSTDVPIIVMYVSGHLGSLNSKGMELSGFSDSYVKDNEFIFKDKNGETTGVIAEMPNIVKAVKVGAFDVPKTDKDMIDYVRNPVELAHKVGCTTITDLFVGILPTTIEQHAAPFRYWATQDSCPMRFVLFPNYFAIPDGDLNYIHRLHKQDNDRVSIGNIKLISDGSIQGYTIHLPEHETYYDGTPNVPMILSKEILEKIITDIHNTGLTVSIHAHGGGSAEVVISVFEQVQKAFPRPDVRHSIEHNVSASDNQLFRMQKIGMVCNFFIGHIYYYGDFHAAHTFGPIKIKRMNPTRSAIEKGVPFSLHSDDPVTEVNPLLTAWMAVNRKSERSGTVYGEDQCLTVPEAMRVITYGAAYLLKQEHIKGSIEPGKLADFTVLKEEPTEQNKETFKDIPILATVVGGKIHLID